jgi:hypothetical protein
MATANDRSRQTAAQMKDEKKMAMKRRIFGKLEFNALGNGELNLAVVVEKTRSTVIILFTCNSHGCDNP